MKLTNKILTGAILFSSCFVTQSLAASLSSYRIFLNPDHPHTKFTLKNASVNPEECEISFNYRKYKEGAELENLSAKEQSEFTKEAQKWFRYSPKKFVIPAKSYQFVAFNLRRIPNAEPVELRTYASFKCVEQATDNGLVGSKPVVVHNVPLTVRSHKNANYKDGVAFSNVSMKGKVLKFRLALTGARSVVGDIVLKNKSGKRLMMLERNSALYPDMKYKDYEFTILGDNLSSAYIEFSEIEKYGGKKRFQLPLKEVL